MAYFKERKRQKELAKLEAAGESLWTSDLRESTRMKLVHALNAMADTSRANTPWVGDPLKSARIRVLRDEGMASLADQSHPQQDVYIALQIASVDLVMSLLEALVVEFGDCSPTDYGNQGLPAQRMNAFQRDVNAAFRSDRFAAEFIDGEIVEFKSRELHVEVIVPTLQLLAKGAEWKSVETAYQKAIREIDDDPGDAITDAGTALQEALLLCGAVGNSLGPLAKSAAKLGLLAAHDSTFVDAVEKMIHWVSADRSETGDAHKLGTEDRDDAWFAIHVVGALIQRLSQERKRGL